MGIKKENKNKMKYLKMAFMGLVLSVSSFANAGFITADEALVLTGGDLGGSYDIGNTIDGSGLSIHNETGTMDGLTINQNTGTAFYSSGQNFGSVEFSFNSSTNIDTFYLWQPIHFNYQYSTTRGVKDFTLEFFDGANSLGLTSLFTATKYEINQGIYGAESFSGFSFLNVTSVILDVKSNWGDSTYWSMHEVGFNQVTSEVPEPSTLAIFALGMIGLASRRFKKQS